MSFGHIWAEATRLLRVLWWYGQTRRTRFGSREALLRHQDRRLAAFTRRLGARSAYFARFSAIWAKHLPRSSRASLRVLERLLNALVLPYLTGRIV